MKNKKFGIIVINDDFFLNFCRDSKSPCGYAAFLRKWRKAAWSTQTPY